MTHRVILEVEGSLPMKRVIKRYSNRKMYDSVERKYVSLHDIAQLIRSGHDVKVLDNKNGEDMTSLTLTNIILEEGKNGKYPLSNETLHEVIRWGGKVFDNSVNEVKERIERLLPKTFNYKRIREFDLLKQKVELLEQSIDEITNQSDKT